MNSANTMPDAYFEAIRCQKEGNLKQAIIKANEALKISPDNEHIHNALATLHFQTKAYEPFFFHMENCIRLSLDNKKHQFNFLHVAKELNLQDFALKTFKKLAFDFPENVEIIKEVGILESALGLYDEAALTYEKLYKHLPSDVNIVTQLGFCLAKSGKLDKAKKTLTDHILNYPDQLTVYVNFAVLLNKYGFFNDAEIQFEKALELSPDNVSILFNYANTLRANRKYQQAIVANEKIISLEPDHAEAHCHKAFCLMTLGELGSGFKEYEWRWKASSFSQGELPLPLWKGEPLKDKTLLLICEQGFGDAIQFIRYGLDLKEMGAKLVLSCRPELTNLLQGMNIFDTIVANANEAKDCHYCVPLMSIPRYIAIERIEDIKTIPPYLETDRPLDDQLKHLLKKTKKPKVGICWRGNPNHLNDDFRSIPFVDFQSLFDLKDIQFVSLQMDRNSEAEKLTDDTIDATVFINDFSDTGAIVKKLDLVICVDTSLAHLCGAFGVPCWTIISSHQDWRWFIEGEDTVWYDSMKIVRNASPNKWHDVIQRVKKDLVTYLSDNSA